MFKWALGYLQGVDDEPSSKRLLGVMSGLVFCGLCLAGGIVQLHERAFGDFQDVLVIIGAYSAGLLGVSVFERRTKAKYSAINAVASKEVREEDVPKQEVKDA